MMGNHLTKSEVLNKFFVSSQSIRISISIIAIIAVQFLFCGQLPTESLRIDILLILPVYFGICFPIRFSLTASFVLGLLMDVLSGSFIGFHMIFYPLISLGVILLDQRVNVLNITYKIAIIGCVSVLEVIFLSFVSFLSGQKLPFFVSFSYVFLYRTLLIMAVGPVLLKLLPVPEERDFKEIYKKFKYPNEY